MAEIVVWFAALAVIVLGAWQWRRFLAACRRANRVDWGGDIFNLIDGFNRIFCYKYHRLNVVGLRLPQAGPAIIVSNHVSGLDPMLLIATARRPLRFLIAREQYRRFGLQWLFDGAGCIPVDRERRPERALRAALKALRDGEVVALFPHGKIHLDSDHPRKIKAGAVRLAQLSGAPIFPMRIDGVRGAGHVLLGPLLRGHARIKAYPAIEPAEWELSALTEELQSILDGHR